MAAEKLPIGTAFVASRVKSAVLTLCSTAFVVLGLFMIHQRDLRPQFAGWLSILFFGACSILWLGGIVVPTRLIITAEGFSVKRLLFPERKYAWEKIDRLWAMQRPIAPMVVWTYKERPKLLARGKSAVGQPNGYDGGLSPVWRISAAHLAAKLKAQRTRNLPRS
jgi:hypothetical protein